MNNFIYSNCIWFDEPFLSDEAIEQLKEKYEPMQVSGSWMEGYEDEGR